MRQAEAFLKEWASTARIEKRSGGRDDGVDCTGPRS